MVTNHLDFQLFRILETAAITIDKVEVTNDIIIQESPLSPLSAAFFVPNCQFNSPEEGI